jgi:hypothetical protein
MRPQGDNLLTTLYRWAHRQDENFLTEAFAHLLRRLLSQAPAAASDLLNYLTDNRFVASTDRMAEVKVCTQRHTDLGTPDIEVRLPEHLVFIEAKDQSGLGNRQLHRYRSLLDRSGTPQTTLVLLTRFLPDSGEADSADVKLRWYGVAEHLGITLKSHRDYDPVTRHLIDQFVGFLRSRGMTMDKVTWELAAGLEAFWNLYEMLGEAITAHHVSVTRSVGQEWAGYYMDRKRGWVGITWEAPTRLVFQTAEEATYTGESIRQMPTGRVGPTKNHSTGLRWFIELDLESEEEHFFARSRASQMQRLEQFVGEGLSGLSMVEGHLN